MSSEPVVLSLGINQQEASYELLISAASDLGNPGPPTAANPVNEFLVEYSLTSNGTSVAPVSSGPLTDVDGDSVPDALEIALGTNPTSYSTANNGIGDSDAQVSGIRESYLTLVSHGRSLYYSGSDHGATTTFAGSYAFTTTPQTDIIPGWPSLNAKLNAKGFPTTPPSDWLGLDTALARISRPPGTEYCVGESDATPPAGSPSGCLHANLGHKRSWGLLSIAPVANTTLNLLRVTSRAAKPGGTPVITTATVPLHFVTGSRRSTDFIDLLPDFNSTNGETVKVSLLYPEIKPDANMAGVLGDNIPSAVPGSTIKHFVTPKKSTDLNQDYVILKASGMTTAQITPGHADQVLVWEVIPSANGQAVPGDPLRCRIKRDATGKTEVKLKTKTGGTVLAQTQVWVVWATASPPVKTAIVQLRETVPIPGIKITGGYDFTFTVQPLTIFSEAERPDFGEKTVILPGHDVNGKTLNEGANQPWDISRQVRGQYIGMESYGTRISLADKLPNIYPSNPIEGNDDSNRQGETNTPQINDGKLTSSDLVERSWADLNRPLSFDTPAVSWKLHFREFTRLQIGSKWYLVSDYQLWRFHAVIGYNNGIWNHANSVLEADNADW